MKKKQIAILWLTDKQTPYCFVKQTYNYGRDEMKLISNAVGRIILKYTENLLDMLITHTQRRNFFEVLMQEKALKCFKLFEKYELLPNNIIL